MAKYKCIFESITSDGGYGIKDFKQWIKDTRKDVYIHNHLRLKLISIKLVKRRKNADNKRNASRK